MRNIRMLGLRTVLIAFMLLFVATSVFAGGAQEKTEPVRWVTSVQGGREPAEEPLFEDEVERLTGIEVEMIKPPSSEYATKVTTMLSTGEPVDLVYLDAGIMAELLEQDLFEPLTDRIENSPVLSDEEIIPQSEWDRIRQPDGEIYGVFNKFEQGTLPIVRYDWLENLGLDEPETLDDYYEVLHAFTYDDPDGNGKDDTYGMVIGYTLYETNAFFGAYDLARGFQKDEDGNLYSPYATEEAIPVYEFLAKLYEEDILEPNFVTNNSANFRDMFMTDQAGMTFYWAAWVGLFNQTVKSENPDAEFKARGLEPPKGPDGDQRLLAGQDGLMAIPKYSDKKDEAFEIMEFWHTEEGNILSSLGIENHDWVMEDGEYKLTEIGEEHGMDHGAPQPKSLKWENPIGELEGFEEAAEIVLEYGVPQMVTQYDSLWEDITRGEAAKIIMGEITPEEGIENMNRRFEEEGIF
ncbi:MAG: extracellular solute-binding protein [Spirochaetota bacterium]